MNKYDPKLCAQLLALREKATPGPYFVQYDNADYSGGGQWYSVGPAQKIGWHPFNSAPAREAQCKADADYFAAIHDLHDQLTALQEVARRQREALEIIAGKRQCIDNLMGNVDVAEAALALLREGI